MWLGLPWQWSEDCCCICWCFCHWKATFATLKQHGSEGRTACPSASPKPLKSLLKPGKYSAYSTNLCPYIIYRCQQLLPFYEPKQPNLAANELVGQCRTQTIGAFAKQENITLLGPQNVLRTCCSCCCSIVPAPLQVSEKFWKTPWDYTLFSPFLGYSKPPNAKKGWNHKVLNPGMDVLAQLRGWWTTVTALPLHSVSSVPVKNMQKNGNQGKHTIGKTYPLYHYQPCHGQPTSAAASGTVRHFAFFANLPLRAYWGIALEYPAIFPIGAPWASFEDWWETKSSFFAVPLT